MRKKVGNCLQLNQQKKIPDSRNAKEHYQSFLKKKQQKLHVIYPRLKKFPTQVLITLYIVKGKIVKIF